METIPTDPMDPTALEKDPCHVIERIIELEVPYEFITPNKFITPLQIRDVNGACFSPK